MPRLDDYPIQYLIGNESCLLGSRNCEKPFANEIISALTALSQYLITESRSEPDIVAAGFWLRKSQLLKLKQQYSTQGLEARGCVFHIAPGNVDTLFFYSVMLSVLCGNRSILRINNHLSPLAAYLIKLINNFIALQPTNNVLHRLLCIIQYEHDDVITSMISSFADVRVIWGGDKTVNHLSKLPIKEDGNNVTFPDRYSVAVIQLLDENQLTDAVDKLMSDIKPFLQQACSSPKVIYWLNTETALQDKFWQLLAEKMAEDVTFSASELVAQLVYLQRLAILGERRGMSHRQFNTIQVVEPEKLSLQQITQHCGLWVLLSQQIDSLQSIKLFEHCQTVTFYGVEQGMWQQWTETTTEPMKRWIPAGHALVFSHIWDGVDLIAELTSEVTVMPVQIGTEL